MSQLRSGTVHGNLTNALRTMIRGGEYAPSARLPTEEELAASHGVSRQTVRRAYEALVQEGLITRVQGRGTFVVPVLPEAGYARTGSSIEDLLILAMQGDLEVVSPFAIAEPAVEASPLQFDGPIATMVRRHRVDGQVTNLTTISVPEPVYETIRGSGPSQSRAQGSILGAIEDHWSSPVRGVKQRIAAQLCHSEHADLLECSPGEAILDIDRLYYDDNGLFVEHTRSLYVGQRFSYLLELRRTSP